MKPMYNTKTFVNVWNEVTNFTDDLANSPFANVIPLTAQQKLFYLLYARYGNNPIANRDEFQFKMKIFSVIDQYGPTWIKKLDIQEKLRNLTEEDITSTSKTITNHAFNPSSEPSTSGIDELSYIDNQQATMAKKGKLEGYSILFGVLDQNVTADFIEKFKDCFKQFVAPEHPVLYTDEETYCYIDEEEE